MVLGPLFRLGSKYVACFTSPMIIHALICNLGITAAALCLASVGSATFVLLERKAMGNPNNRRVNDSDQEPRSGSGYYSALTTNLDTTGEF